MDGKAKVADCSGAETVVVGEDGLGYVTFSPGGAAGGCNPCLADCAGPVPVEKTTWGAIKALYGR